MAGRSDLLELLARARDRGFLGPDDPAKHLDHARGFAEVVEAETGASPARVVDLGTGGGVPGLVLAADWPDATVVLVESSSKRAAWLTEAVTMLHWGDRVEICAARADDLAHEPGRRESFDVVTARSFAAPAVTAEIGTGLVAVGGLLVVSEPPEPGERWPDGPLGGLGLGPAGIRIARGAHYACIWKVRPAAPESPRRRGRAAKRPLWGPRST